MGLDICKRRPWLDENPFGEEGINDGRWFPKADPLTPRHSGRAALAFADGHMELKPPEFGKDALNYRADK